MQGNLALQRAAAPAALRVHAPARRACPREVCCRATAGDAPAVVSGSDLLGGSSSSKASGRSAGGPPTALPAAERLAALELKSGVRSREW